MLRYLIFMALIVFFSGCAHRPHSTVAQEIEAIPMRQIGPFTHVVVTGQVDVMLHTQARTPQVKLYGDPRDTAAVGWTVLNGVLQVDLGKGFPKYGPVRVDISSRYLTSFHYKGIGTITGRQLRSQLLDLDIVNEGKTQLSGHMVVRQLNIGGSGVTQISGLYSRQLLAKLSGRAHVQLTGVANVASLKADGESWFSLLWVKSHVLTVRAKDRAFIQLAGISDVLDVALRDNARFNGRYLRGTRTFVKTYGHAEADIATVKRQHTLASDASNIYFYHLPAMKADFMAMNGSVLDMRNWSSPFYQEPTAYNKAPP